MTIHERTHYERLSNGIDLCLVPTSTQDVVVCTMAFPGGVHAVYETQTVALLRSGSMPSGTARLKRAYVRELFDALGAHVVIEDENEHLVVSLASRAESFSEAFTLLVEVLTEPRVNEKEFAEAVVQLDAELEQAKEDTRGEAIGALVRMLYAHGHPHWVPRPSDERTELTHRTRDEVLRFHKDTFSSVGTIVCIAGDISKERMLGLMRDQLERIPPKEPRVRVTVHPERTHSSSKGDAVVSLRDKINVDTYLAIPLSITRDHTDYFALMAGVAVLGGSYTSRLFTSLRTRQSLTYGAYATLAGMGDGYAGYIRASAVFPHDVFSKGRLALREEVARWVEKGITSAELARRKEELSGTYKVGLATTQGLSGAVFGALLSGRGIEYVDNYPHIIESLTLRDVNRAIKEHVHYDLAVSAGAGAVDEEGKPLK